MSVWTKNNSQYWIGGMNGDIQMGCFPIYLFEPFMVCNIWGILDFFIYIEGRVGMIEHVAKEIVLPHIRPMFTIKICESEQIIELKLGTTCQESKWSYGGGTQWYKLDV